MSRDWDYFPPYVCKAEKIRRAKQAVAKMAKKGIVLEPVTITGRKIAHTWWGCAWAENLERYADYSNRIPRGRTYVRSGAVLDLKITPNVITALVSGSSSQPYKIKIGIASLDKKNESALLESSRSSLDSLQALLLGEFPTELKETFYKQGTGLFPSPKDISLDCTCPDWAKMCKHVAAVLYGVAARLDKKPELFFILRGITLDDFVGAMVKQESEKILKKSKVKSTRVIESTDTDISEMFGISMDQTQISSRAQKPPLVAVVKSSRRIKPIVPKKTVSIKKRKLAPLKKVVAKKKSVKKKAIKPKETKQKAPK